MTNPSKDTIFENIEKNKDLNAYIHVVDKNNINESKGLFSDKYIGIKDNIQVKGLPQTNASKFFKDYISPYDATVVKRLKDAGANIVGKLNMDEFAMGASNLYSAYGKVLNPRDKKRVPGGSSGGSAAALAADMAHFTLGSDTGGSIRQPAAYCGVYGYKPTYGVLSRYGLTSFASSLDQIGLFTKKSSEMIDIMNTIAGKDPLDSTSIESPGFIQKDTDISSLKIGIIKEYGNGLKPYIKKVYDKFINFLKDKGADIQELEFPEYKTVISVYQIISTAEASSNLARFDGIRYTARSDCDTIEQTYKESRSDFFGDEVKRRILLGSYVLSRDCFDSYYLKAAKSRTLIYDRWAKMFNSVDFVLTPITVDIPFKIVDQPDPIAMYEEDLYSVLANLTGMPAISFPAGSYGKLPIGLQLTANRLKDNELINLISEIEKEFYNIEKLEKEIKNG